MKNTAQAISTARGVALLRAIEYARPEDERVCADPYARSFIHPLTWLTMRHLIASGLPDRLLLKGSIGFAIVREQYIHDLIVSEARAGLDQVVILGAGFDTRAYRIPEIASVPIFEVDHPVTQAAKREAINGVVDPLPANLVFVPVDFDRDSLKDRLAAAGYDEKLRTLFVWQGVIMYLSPEGIDATLAFIANHSAAGSMVVFDYFYPEFLLGGETSMMRLMTRAMGERLTFGIGAAKIGPFLESRGFGDVLSVGGAELKRRYLRESGARRLVAEGAAIASARVVGTARSAIN